MVMQRKRVNPHPPRSLGPLHITLLSMGRRLFSPWTLKLGGTVESMVLFVTLSTWRVIGAITWTDIMGFMTFKLILGYRSWIVGSLDVETGGILCNLCSCLLPVLCAQWLEPLVGQTFVRYDFQIDLGISPINYGISLDWDGESKKLHWIRQIDFVPCDCEKCYFWLNRHTTGINHKMKRKKIVTEHKCWMRVTSEDCTEKCVSLKHLSGYCRMYYRKQDEILINKCKRRLYNTSSMGCR